MLFYYDDIVTLQLAKKMDELYGDIRQMQNMPSTYMRMGDRMHGYTLENPTQGEIER